MSDFKAKMHQIRFWLGLCQGGRFASVMGKGRDGKGRAEGREGKEGEGRREGQIRDRGNGRDGNGHGMEWGGKGK